MRFPWTGSLKLKEISDIHSEAYAAGELKHGTISLIEPGTLVIGVLTQSKLYEKTMSNMVECRSRGAYLLGLTTYGKYEIEETVDFAVYVPRIDEYFAGSLAVVPLQLLGYYVSVAKGLDVDKPRNLAKERDGGINKQKMPQVHILVFHLGEKIVILRWDINLLFGMLDVKIKAQQA